MKNRLTRLQEALTKFLNTANNGLSYVQLGAKQIRNNSAVVNYNVTGKGLQFQLTIEINDYDTACTIFIAEGWLEGYLLYYHGLAYRHALQLDLIGGHYLLNWLILKNRI
jgi:hypothetical protein